MDGWISYSTVLYNQLQGPDSSSVMTHEYVFDKTNKGILPQSMSVLERGAVWRGGGVNGGQGAFAISGKVLINFEEFL